MAPLPEEIRAGPVGILTTGSAFVAMAEGAVAFFFADSAARILSCCSLVIGTGGVFGGDSGPCARAINAPRKRMRHAVAILAIRIIESPAWRSPNCPRRGGRG